MRRVLAFLCFSFTFASRPHEDAWWPSAALTFDWPMWRLCRPPLWAWDMRYRHCYARTHLEKYLFRYAIERSGRAMYLSPESQVLVVKKAWRATPFLIMQAKVRDLYLVLLAFQSQLSKSLAVRADNTLAQRTAGKRRSKSVHPPASCIQYFHY